MVNSINKNHEKCLNIKEISEPATDTQIAYARRLGIKFPQNVSKHDISALICRKVDCDSAPNPSLIEYAYDKGLLFSKYIGKKALYNKIFHELGLEDKVAFFCLYVYNNELGGSDFNLNNSKYKDYFYEFAKKNRSNKSFISSMNRYDGRSLSSRGAYGGSKETIAYKSVLSFLKDSSIIINELLR